MNILRGISRYLISCFIAYILIGFIKWDFNIMEYEYLSRLSILVVGLLIFWILFGMQILREEFFKTPKQ